MGNLIVILGDQLSHDVSSLDGADVNHDLILMCEVHEEATYVKHHKQKIALIFSAMRHFARELVDRGFIIQYTKFDASDNTHSFLNEISRQLEQKSFEKIVVTHPSEYRVLQNIYSWSTHFQIHVDVREDTRFLCSMKSFADWAQGRKQLRMEYFYRQMRYNYNILMDGPSPQGGKWNYDLANRRPASTDSYIPAPYCSEPDAITQEVLSLVSEHFADHFGDLDTFHFAVTRAQALQVLNHFIEKRLLYFGDFQDAMLEGEPWMYHAHISFYLNCGLLNPLECIQAAEDAYKCGKAPLNAVEGFIRQILGWREYIRGIYWLKMPDYAEQNFFSAKRNLPEFYWTGNTKMNCLRQCVHETQQNAYAHHIQRLMVLGNFALLAGIDPKQVNEWFLIVYADAYEWVELPNVTGMILFADGGVVASKPYASGGAYINKMSNYCKNCTYNISKKYGKDACPFNYLYWDFLQRNRHQLNKNPRIAMMYKTYDRMPQDKKAAIAESASSFLSNIDLGEDI